VGAFPVPQFFDVGARARQGGEGDRPQLAFDLARLLGHVLEDVGAGLAPFLFERFPAGGDVDQVAVLHALGAGPEHRVIGGHVAKVDTVHAQGLQQGARRQVQGFGGDHRLAVIQRRAGRHGGQHAAAGREDALQALAVLNHGHAHIVRPLGALDGASPLGRQERAGEGRARRLESRPGGLVVAGEFARTDDFDTHAAPRKPLRRRS
jgi:hypothetical protein